MAETLAEKLRSRFNTDKVYVICASLALGAQLGMGALALAVLGDLPRETC